MPYYENLQYGSRAILAEQGWPVYLFGSRDPNVNTSYVTSVALASNVATVGISPFEGPLPKVGQIITIRGTQNNVGAFNVTNAVITAVSVDASGAGTVSFALTGADFGIAGDVGTVKIVSAVTGETIVAGASIPATSSRCSREYGVDIFCDVQFPTIPTACTVTLQTAMRNIDSDFTDAVTVATVAGGAVTQSQANYTTTAPFYRFRISGLTGAGTIAATVVN